MTASQLGLFEPAATTAATPSGDVRTLSPPERRFSQAHPASARPAWWPVVFVLSLAWPSAIVFPVGPIALPVYRVVLLVGAILIAARLLRGKLRLRTADNLIVLFAVVMATSIIANHGLFSPFPAYSERGPSMSVGYEAAVIAVLETAGAYFLARAAVTRPEHFEAVMKALGWVTLVVCVFTVLEARSGVNLFGVYQGAGTGELRFGLHRAAGPFPHSILWGLFAAAPFAYFAAQAARNGKPAAILFTGASLIGVATSVSTTAVMAVAIQAVSLGWARIAGFKGRWTLLLAALVIAAVVIELLSTRSAAEIIVSTISFSPWNGLVRLIQWEHGWRNVMEHPFLGLGFHDWSRPDWLAASLDSYWLVLAVRHGLIPPILLIAAMAAMLSQAAKAFKRRDTALRTRRLIRVWAVTVVAIAVAGSSVHFWAQSVAIFFFLLGCLGGLSQPEARRRSSS